MRCESCECDIPSKSTFCLYCGVKQVTITKSFYSDPLGTWEVSTEGDEEGRSTRDLGTHTGYVDEIAKALAPISFYSLHFKAVRPSKQHLPNPQGTINVVNVKFDIESGTWDMSKTQRATAIDYVFRDRPVSIEPGDFHASFNIVFKK